MTYSFTCVRCGGHESTGFACANCGSPPKSRCESCDAYVQEIAQMADELAFWKHSAIWHRAYLRTGAPVSDAADRQAELELEKIRRAENAERYAHAEPGRDPGAT